MHQRSRQVHLWLRIKNQVHNQLGMNNGYANTSVWRTGYAQPYKENPTRGACFPLWITLQCWRVIYYLSLVLYSYSG
jgi:hypothetical protein